MLSIIIVNYNCGSLLVDNVTRLLGLRDGTCEIIVVDNASDDGSIEAVAQLPSRDTALRVVRNNRNRGFAAACNQGVRQSQGTVLLFLNPDCVVDSDAIRLTHDALAASPDIAMAGALILNPDGSEQRGCRRRAPDFHASVLHLTGLSRLFPQHFQDFNATGQPLPAEPTDVEAISGAFMMVKRSALAAVGYWDEGYFLHVEDLDLCQRLRDQGYRIVFVPQARVTHAHGGCSSRHPVRVEWYKHRGMWRYYLKHQAGSDSALWRGAVAISIAMHFALRALTRSLRRLGAQPAARAVTR